MILCLDVVRGSGSGPSQVEESAAVVCVGIPPLEPGLVGYCRRLWPLNRFTLSG